MATLFGPDATSLAEPRGAGAQPIQGVQTPASQIQMPTGILDIGVQVFRDVSEKRKNDIKEGIKRENNLVLTDYSRARMNIAQSNLPLSEKTARMAAIDSQFQLVATERGILEDFKKARDLMTSGGITGEINTEAEAQRKRREENITFLRGNDIIVPPNADDDYIQALMENHAEVETALKNYNRNQQRIKDAQGHTLFSQGQLDRTREEEATAAITQIAGTSLTGFNLQAQAISDRVLSGEINEEQARAELIGLGSKYTGIINNLSAHNSGLASVWRDQYNGIIQSHLEIVTNRDTSVKRSIDRRINLAALITGTNNPELMEIASLNPYLGDNTLAQVVQGNRLASDIILRSIGTDYQDTGVRGPNIVGDPENKTAETLSYGFIRQGISQIRAGVADEAAKKGYYQAANNILTMLGSKTPGDFSATDLKDVASFMLSPEFVYFVKDGGINQNAASTASRVFKQVYGQALDGVVRQGLEKELPRIGGSGIGGRSIYPEGISSYKDIVDVVFMNGKASFVLREGIQDQLERGNIPAIQRELRTNLKEQEEALNRNLKLAAHLSGTTDYREYWEQNKDELMPYMFGSSEKLSKPVNVDGVEWEYIGPPGGRTDLPENWRRVNGGSEE